MADDIPFDRDFAERPGEAVRLSPLLRRVVAPNPGPFTFKGTCSYIVGAGEVAVVDPGPEDPAHLAALLAALGDERVAAILVTHTHRDHSPGARALQAATGAPILGCGPHRPARPSRPGEEGRLDASSDSDHHPDRELRDAESASGPGWDLVAVETPGHTANHLAFALPQENALLSGDHVMAWSTTIVAPPDGSMADYMASLARLQQRRDTIYWPGHGGPVREPARFVRALAHHRRQREASILDRLAQGDDTIPAIVARIYEGLAPALRGAAGLSVLAHLEDLEARGRVVRDGEPGIAGRYRVR
jgi:glyoxylase-like metal-dependent hydrolase (beta-lactamase superfamily II)